MFFPATYAQVALSIAEDADRRGQGPHRRPRGHRQAHRQRPDAARHHARARAGRCSCGSSATRCTPPLVERLKDVLATHPGHHRGAPAPAAARNDLLRLGDDYRVTPSAALMGDLKALLGPSAISA